MPTGRGGARTKSGPGKNPTSRTSERAGFSPTALPSEGYTKRPPGLNAYITKPTPRHRAVWEELWRTPQAMAWSIDKWRWPVVADLCRRMVQSEDPDAPVAVATAIRQLRDDLALSEAGLKQHGWAIARDEVATKRTQKKTEPVKRERRLRSVKSAQR